MNTFSEWYLHRLMFTFAALGVMSIVSFLAKKGIDIVFSRIKSKMHSWHSIAKTRTMRGLLKNVIDAALLIMGLLVILSNWGVNIGPILAGAGIVGLAVSFGSQTLIKDIISGFFIILEDQYNIGDKIKIGTFEGEVSRITLRLTVLRDKDANLIYIPNSQITNVIRYSNNKK